MSKLTMDEFMKDTDGKNRSDILDWKEEGKITVWLHPKSGIHKRNSHWLLKVQEVEEEVGKGKKKKKVKKNKAVPWMVICPNTSKHKDRCGICILRSYLRDNDDIELEDVILEFEDDDGVTQFTKGEIIGEDGFDWKKNLAYRTEYLFGVIDDEKQEKVEVLISPKSLGKKIKKVIANEMEDEGDEDGNPFINPYAFKLTYDSDANPNDMYDANRSKAKLTEEVEELLNGEGVDLEKLTTPTNPSEIAEVLKEAIVHDDIDVDELFGDILEFDEDDEDEDDIAEDKRLKKDSKKGKNGKKNKKKVEDDIDNDEDEEPKKNKKGKKKTKDVEDEDIEEEKPKNNKKNKLNKKDKKQDLEECPECGEMIPKSAKVCPECNAEFVDDEDTIECPECGEDVDVSLTECPECGAEINPF